MKVDNFESLCKVFSLSIFMLILEIQNLKQMRLIIKVF